MLLEKLMDEYVFWNDKFCDALDNENFIFADLAQKKLDKLIIRINKTL